MRRNTLNFLVDAVSLAVLFGMIATGLVIRFILPPGTGGRHGEPHTMLWGMGRHDWGDVHFWLAAAIVVLMLVHVALHWAWVCGTVQRFFRRGEPGEVPTPARRRNLYGVGFLAIVVAALGLFFWSAWRHAVTSPGGGQGQHGPPWQTEQEREADAPGSPGGPHGRGGEGRGWGSMTLAEIEADTGVAVAVIREDLGLPETVPPDARLGRLRQQYGFEMSAVHAIIERHQATSKPAD